MQFPVIAKTLGELRAQSQPEGGSGQSEALAWTFYDTAIYSSGVTTELVFFTTSRATRQLSNLNGRGLPEPQYFEIFYFNLDVLTPAGNSTPLEDTWEVLNGTGTAAQGGPTWTFILADKQIGPFPLSGLQGLGALTGFTTQGTTEYAQNTDGSGGFCSDGAITIPPNQTFSIVLTWPAAVTLSADRALRVSMTGTLHRRIL